jgi:Flp pilus assembly protein TadG
MKQGQVLMVVAISMVVIVAILGLALDVGVMFIGNARLRRAVDAAALAAALQIREGYTIEDLDTSARNFLSLNGIQDASALVQICDGEGDHYYASLCTNPRRKLVRVVASGTVHLAFLPVLGIDEVTLNANAISETASVEVVLVLDRSDSMTWTATAGDPMRDPSVCNDPDNSEFDAGYFSDSSYDSSYHGYCRPFYDVQQAAVAFVEQLYFPYDRVAVVTFAKDAAYILDFSSDKDTVISMIKDLTVYQGDEDVSGDAIYPNGNPSRWYDSEGVYWGLGCPQYDAKDDPDLKLLYPTTFGDPSPCTTTNIGQGLYNAGNLFANARQGALWVTILLTDGVANAGYGENDAGDKTYFCPESTWDNTDIPPKCNDGDSSTHHVSTSEDYDAEDYAYNAADFVATGQHSLIFTIGLGSKVTQASTVDGTALGEVFLNYAADNGGGLYTGATPDDLLEVFLKIADNIATRLTH